MTNIIPLNTRTDWLRLATDLRIEELRDYLETLNSQLAPMAEERGRRLDAHASQIQDPVERSQFDEFASNEYWKYKDTFPRILFNTFLVAAFTLLESEFTFLVDGIGRKQNQVFTLSDIKGNSALESACLYVKKIAGIDCKSYDAWQSIKEAQRLRNIIVHSNGKLTREDDLKLAENRTIIDKSGISILSGRSISQISISYNYANGFLTAVDSFFSQLYPAISQGNYL